MILTHYVKNLIALNTKQIICPTGRNWVRKHFVLLALSFNRMFTLQSYLDEDEGVGMIWHCKTYMVMYTLKLCKPMEMLLVDACSSGFRPFLVFLCFFDSCIWKKPFSVTKERGWQLLWWNTTPYRKSLY